MRGDHQKILHNAAVDLESGPIAVGRSVQKKKKKLGGEDARTHDDKAQLTRGKLQQPVGRKHKNKKRQADRERQAFSAETPARRLNESEVSCK